MMATIYLIRHGEVVYRYDDQGRKLIYGPDAHLSNKGRRQVKELAERLRKRGVVFDVIYTSPYNKAYESAFIIARSLNIGQEKVLIESGLKDVWAPGWIGTSMDELKSLSGDIYSQPPKTGDQETLEQLSTRIVHVFNVLVEREKGKTIGIISHGDPLRVLIYRLENPDGKMPKMSILSKSAYLKKGEAWRLVFDQESRFFEKELIIRDKKSISGQKDY